MMNRELANAIEIYSLSGSKRFASHLMDLSKPSLVSIISDLMTMYINDRNSSTLREFVTVTLAGYRHEEHKIGYNGFKHSAYGKPIRCEAKPVNVRSDTGNKLNGGANFTDLTWKRFRKYMRDKINVLVSGFVDGRLIYIFEFPFSCPEFSRRLRRQLSKKFPHGDVKGMYLRSASFVFKHYKNCKDLRVVFSISSNELDSYRDYLTRDVFRFLKGVAEDEND